jgi:putative ABC transport system substrate-binding protein
VPVETAALPEQAPLDKQIETIRKILPQAKRVGLIYDPTEPASVAAIKQLLDLLSKSGMNPVEVTVPHEWDVGPAVRNLIGRVDLVYTVFDDNVAAQYAIVAQTCDQAHIPLFTANPRQVRLGAMASLGLAGKTRQAAPAVGRTTAHRPARPERTIAGAWLYLNLEAAAHQGVTVPDDVLKSAVLVSQARAANTGRTKNDPPKADGVKP